MKKLFCLFSGMLLLFPIFVCALEVDENSQIDEEQKKTEEIVTLEKCIDGDSAKFKSNDGTIITYRFLAIDAPEIDNIVTGAEPFSEEASKYTCDMLTNAEKIVLEFDEEASKEDEYNRGLAWTFVDDVLLQEKLIEKGYAKVGYLYGSYKYTAELQEKEEEAKKKKIGIWQEEDEETLQEVIENAVKEEATNSFFSFINQIIENIIASLNNLVDSILQSIEDML